mgnify:CR=1 FL=1
METPKEAAHGTLNQTASLMQTGYHISEMDKRIWALAKSGAALRSIRLSTWLMEAIEEKYEREVK